MNIISLVSLRVLHRTTLFSILGLLAGAASSQGSPDIVWNLGGHTNITSMAYSPDGNLIATSGRDMTVKLWRASDGALLRSIGAGYDNYSVAFSRDSQFVAIGDNSGAIKIWNSSDGSLYRTLSGHRTIVRGVAFSPGGGMLASASDDQTVILWDWQAGSPIRTLTANPVSFGNVAFSPDGTKVLAGEHPLQPVPATNNHSIGVQVWTVSTGNWIRTLAQQSGPINTIAVSSDGLLATGSQNRRVSLWRIDDGTLLHIAQEAYQVDSVAFSPNAPLLAIAANQLTVRAVNDWSVQFQATGIQYFACTFAPNGRSLAAGPGGLSANLECY